jgi:hypothetical protein
MKYRVTFPGGLGGVFKAYDHRHAINTAAKRFEMGNGPYGNMVCVPACDVCEADLEPTDPIERGRFIDKTYYISRRSVRLRTCPEMGCAIKGLERLVSESGFHLPAQQVISTGGLPLSAPYTSGYVSPAPVTAPPVDLDFAKEALVWRYKCDNPRCEKLGFRSYQELREHKKENHAY